MRGWTIVGVALIAISFLSACAGSHSSGLSSLPAVPNAKAHAASLSNFAASDVAAINAGGAAAGNFAADMDFAGNGSWTYATTKAIDVSGVTNPAPQAVYQTQREGPAVSYLIPGLTPGTAYTVKLGFAELWWNSAGKRVFNISINNTSVLSNFDIFAAAGAADKAVSESFAAIASSAGTISITLNAVTNNAAIDAIEVAPSSTAPPAGLNINTGGAASGSFAADEDFGAGTWTYGVTNAIDTSGVSNPAPVPVYQDEREGPAIAYTIPGLTAGGTYTVRLDFAELWWTSARQRVFNVSINNATVLTNFDVFATAGARFKAVAESFPATASSTGTIAIALNKVTDNAALNGIEITPGSTATPAPTPTPSTALVDWPTYGYDPARSGFNPYSTAITPASVPGLHLAWQTTIGGATQTQPIVVTNVAGHQALLIVANFAIAQAYDSQTGKLVWQTTLPTQDVQDCGVAGISGTAQYDKALGAIFMAAGTAGGGAPNHTVLYRLDAGSGTITGQVDITPTLLPGEANYSHSGITLANGRIYLGTGSDCEGTVAGKYPSWRGRVVAVDPSGMTLLGTFLTTYGQGGNFGGGGVWGWGGVSADPSGNIYVATGNAETVAAAAPQTIEPPFQPTTDEQAGFAEHLIKLSADLSTVEGSNYPGFNFAIGYADLDYSGTPVIFAPPVTAGCGVLSATQGKGGTLVVNNTQNVAELNSFNLSVPSGSAYYIGNPAYSPSTGYLYAAITSAGAGSSMLPPGLAAIGGCGSSIVWHAQFGPDSALYSGENPRSAPTVTAGGVVFLGTPCTPNGSGGCGTPGAVGGALWAVDGTTGAVLGGGKPIVVTAGNIRMAPSVDGQWLFLLDDSGNLYAFTVNPSIPAVVPRSGMRVPRSFKIRAH